MEENEKKVKIKASSAASKNEADSSSTGARTSALDKKYWKIKIEGLEKARPEDEESPVTEPEVVEATAAAEEAAPSVEETPIEETSAVEEAPIENEEAIEEEVVAESNNEETIAEEAVAAPAEENIGASSNEDVASEEPAPAAEEAPVEAENASATEEVAIEALNAPEAVETAAEESPVEESAPVEETPAVEEPAKEEEAPAPSRLEEMSDTYYADVADSEKIKGKKASSVLKDSGYKETVLKEGEIVIVEEEENKPTPEEIEAAKEEEIEIPTEDRPVKFEVKEEEKVVENDEFDYIGKNKIIEDNISNTISGDEDIARLSELLGAGSVHTLRFRRRETGSFDMTWIRAIEDAIPAIDEILKNPRITTKIVTDIVPVELAKKTGSESVKHLASHTQFVKDIDEEGNVIPSKILNIGSDDEYLTYENKFVATCVRRLVLFIEKRYEYITKYSSLKDYEILYIKNHATVNGLDVDVQSKVVVSRPSESGASMDETDGIMRRINLLRRYAKFFYASDFMKKFKNEKNTRSPIMQTNIIRKNPKYHKVYNLFRFMESYSALGVQFATKETYFGVEEEDKKTISNLTVANFLAVKAEPTSKDITTVVETKTPEVLTTVDDDIFTFFPVGAYPEFIRIDEEYVNWRERNTKDLKENPSPEEKAYRGNDYLRKAKAERERKRREELIARREKARLEWFSEQERLQREAEEERIRQERLAKEAEEAAALAELEAARAFVKDAAINEDEDLLLATVLPIEITISGEREIVAKETYTQLATVVEFYISDPSLVWSSSDPSIATVDETGFVSGWKEGDVTIRATSVEDPTCFTDYEMHVYPRPPVEVYIPEIEKILVTKETTLTPIVRHADDLSVMWSTSNAAVATVENGVVHAHSAGKCIITAYSKEDNTSSCSIVVRPLDGIELSSPTNSIVSRRTTLQISAISNVSPDDMIMFFSSNEGIATVTQSGFVEGISWDGGDVTITAISTLDPTILAKFKVHVDPKPIVSVELEGRPIAILNRAHQLLGTVINAVDPTAIWTSSDENILTVDEYGYVTGKSLGSATITCASLEEQDKIATVEIEVKEAVVITSPNFEVVAKKSIQMSAITNVTDDDTVTWSCSDENLATVDETGLVTASASGDVVITASSVYDPTLFANYELHIRPEVEVHIAGEAKAIVSKTPSFTCEVLWAYDPSVTWSSSDENIMMIDENGDAMALSAGVVTITVTSTEDETKSDSIEVTVLDGIELIHEIESVIATHTITWSAISNVSENDTIVWSSSDENVATVENGTILGIALGSATITATSAEDSTLSASFDVSVGAAIEIELTGDVKLIKNRSNIITANVLYATDATLTWSTSDENIVTVEDGRVTGVEVGSATITATSVEDDTRSATFDIIVKDGIELTYDELSFVSHRGNITMSAISNVSDEDTVIWASSNEEIATVNDGVVEGVSVNGGEVVIRAASSIDPDLYKEATVTIEPKPIVSVTLSGENKVIVGKTLQLTAEVVNAIDPTVAFSSSNDEVALVDENGLVSGIKGGEATISATSIEEDDKVATLDIEVLAGIVVEYIPETITVDRPVYIKASSNVSENDTLIYAVSDENIAKVDSNGEITGLREGEVELHISSSLDMTETVSSIILVKPQVEISITGEDSLVVRGTTTFFADIMNASDAAIRWSSSDENIATVDENGLITAVNEGKVTITATSVEDSSKVASKSLEIYGPITVEEGDNEVFVTKTLEIVAHSNFSEDDVLVYASSDETIAIVDEKGVVTGVAVGSATITITSTVDPLSSVEKEITIIPKAEIEIDVYGTNKVYVGKTSTFTAYVQNADDPSVEWFSSSDDIATVNQEGVVTPIAPGEVTILVTSKEDDTKSASISFQVVEGILLTADTTEVQEEESIAWDAKSDLEDDTIIWSSSDESVATVNKGMIVGVKPGKCTITASSSGDPDLMASKEVTVLEKPEIVLEVTPITKINVEDTAQIVATISNAKNEALTYECSSDCITLDETGLITGIKDGKATITVTSVEDPSKTQSFEIECVTPVYLPIEVTILNMEIVILNGRSLMLEARVDNARKNSEVTWAIDSDECAILDGNNLNSVQCGTVRVTATSVEDPEKSASIDVNIVEGLVIECPYKEISVSDSIKLNATSKVGKKDIVRWSTSNSAIATITSDGTLTGVGQGAVSVFAASSIHRDVKVAETIYVKPLGGDVSEGDIANAIEEEKKNQLLRDRRAATSKKGHRMEFYLKKKKK